MKRKLEVDNCLDISKKQKIYDSCPICLEVIQDCNYVVTKCNHKFCFSCLMNSCNVNNKCPLCRAEIEEYKKKKLPVFKHIDMFDNIVSSINNPNYDIYNLIDGIKETIFDELLESDDNISEQENIFKNSILRRLQYSTDLISNIDLSIMDNIYDFINKVIIDNTFRMCNWYNTNYN